jgi:hypothetical protein
VLVLIGFAHETTDYVVIPPVELYRRLKLLHPDDPRMQSYFWILDAITRAATTPNGRTARPFNPLSREDRTLFEVLLAGEYALHGFTNRDLRSKLGRTPFPLAKEPEKQPGQVTRLLRRCTPTG